VSAFSVGVLEWKHVARSRQADMDAAYIVRFISVTVTFPTIFFCFSALGTCCSKHEINKFRSE
jgi:hypothetical protein